MRHFLMLSLIAGIVFACVPAWAQTGACNQQMLRGIWCETCSGFTDLSKFNPNVPKGTLVPIKMLIRTLIGADGKGTSKGAGSLAGTILTIEGEENFAINSDCTGEKTYTLNINGTSLPGRAAVVYLPLIGEFQILIQVAGDVVSCKYKKMLHTTVAE